MKKHACRWIVVDLSCASGLTPLVVDQLNNLGRKLTPNYDVNPRLRPSNEELARPKACSAQSFQNDCPNHAAYELDPALGAGLIKTMCVQLSTPPVEIS